MRTLVTPRPPDVLVCGRSAGYTKTPAGKHSPRATIWHERAHIVRVAGRRQIDGGHDTDVMARSGLGGVADHAGATGPERRGRSPAADEGRGGVAPALAARRLLYYIICVNFAWEAKKAARNLEKHGVSFEEAQTAFDDELGAYYPDTLRKDRFILIGQSKRRRLLYVVHAEVTANAIRIISARKATKHEKAHYEND
jgi:uncharacterized protein